jgi:hypothetical protein
MKMPILTNVVESDGYMYLVILKVAQYPDMDTHTDVNKKKRILEKEVVSRSGF